VLVLAVGVLAAVLLGRRLLIGIEQPSDHGQITPIKKK
jgi:hypothetical protein